MSSLVLSDIGYVVGERRRRALLSDIDLEFAAGMVTALSGPSGSGKTTLLSVAGGLVEPTTGTTSYAGESMWRGTGDPRPEVAFVLQVYGLVPILSARENVSVALRARGVDPGEADELAEAALARFHIADLGDRQVEELSGGQMQRVALARGVCVDSGVLLADEPTSELDEGNRGLVLRELRREAERGAVVVVATHDPAVVDACDRHFVLDEGRLTDHVAPVDAHRLSRELARPERLVEEAKPPALDLDAGSVADRPRHRGAEPPSPRPRRRTTTAGTPANGEAPDEPPRPADASPTSRADAAGRRRGVPAARRAHDEPMIRTLRGAWSRRWTLLPLLLLTSVVVAGTVTVISFAEAAGTSPLLAVPLLLLGVVAVPGTARELAIARREEVALARLRGLEGGELSSLLTAEPLIVLVLGGVGRYGARRGRRPGGGGRLGRGRRRRGLTLTAVLAVLAIVAVGLVALVVGMVGSLNEPLVQQVSISARPRSSSAFAIFGSVLVIVAAVVASYRSSVSSDDPDWVVLAGPALVGIAVGQVVVWLLRALARVAVPATARRGLGGFLAVRRLARVVDAVTPVRLLVAAAVVAALAVTGADQVGDWTDDTARLRAGAPLQVRLDVDAPAALRLTREVDPDGEYLMAAVLVPGTGAIPNRRAFLDTERFDAVLGDFYAGTPADGIGCGRRGAPRRGRPAERGHASRRRSPG